MNELTEEQIENLNAKIDSEGFDYYFTDYGPDEVLEKLAKAQISAYRESRENLIAKLKSLGLEVS